MRWQIKENKRCIVSYDFKNHQDDIEMSGEKVSMIVKYGVDNNNNVSISRRLIFPMFRIQPDVTTSSYQFEDNSKPINFGNEKFVKVEINGLLSIFTETDDFKIVHRFYPSTTHPIAYERIEITKKTQRRLPPIKRNVRINSTLGCEGWIYTDRLAYQKENVITFAYNTRFCNEKIIKEKDSYEKRQIKVEELLQECDLTTGSEIIDTMFAFAKIRAGEAIFNTRNGKIHCPCGGNYYAAIWANDQCEYSTPWFAFTNDKNEIEAAKNSMEWFERYMNDCGKPLVSSIISEGTDYWNQAKDRGDSEMYLYGNTRFYLTRGERPDKRHLNMLQWAATYIESQILESGIVYSDTDELENRLSSGINLATSSLAFGAFMNYSVLLERLGDKKQSQKYYKLAQNIKQSIESYFGGNVSGFETYHYHQGLNVVRAWVTLPAYMGIYDRAKGSMDAIDKLLWKDGGCISTENEKIMWDRSALYYIATLFRTKDSERGYAKLVELSTARLLGERVPYVVEAYPEYNMRHLSAESALFCRIITDGLLNISFDANGFNVNPSLPKEMKHVSFKNVYLNKCYYDIEVNENKVELIKH